MYICVVINFVSLFVCQKHDTAIFVIDIFLLSHCDFLSDKEQLLLLVQTQFIGENWFYIMFRLNWGVDSIDYIFQQLMVGYV